MLSAPRCVCSKAHTSGDDAELPTPPTPPAAAAAGVSVTDATRRCETSPRSSRSDHVSPNGDRFSPAALGAFRRSRELAHTSGDDAELPTPPTPPEAAAADVSVVGATRRCENSPRSSRSDHVSPSGHRFKPAALGCFLPPPRAGTKGGMAFSIAQKKAPSRGLGGTQEACAVPLASLRGEGDYSLSP